MQLGYFFLAIILFFLVLILVLLKVRAKNLKDYVNLSSDQLWDDVKERVKKFDLKKNQLLYSILQDESLSVSFHLIRDHQDQTIARVDYQRALRQRTIQIEDKMFIVTFPLTWSRSAILSAPDGSILATYEEKNWPPGLHVFDIKNFGSFSSTRGGTMMKSIFNYPYEGKVLGTRQEISPTFQKGRLILFPEDLSLEVRIFILTI